MTLLLFSGKSFAGTRKVMTTSVTTMQFFIEIMLFLKETKHHLNGHIINITVDSEMFART